MWHKISREALKLLGVNINDNKSLSFGTPSLLLIPITIIIVFFAIVILVIIYMLYPILLGIDIAETALMKATSVLPILSPVLNYVVNDLSFDIWCTDPACELKYKKDYERKLADIKIKSPDVNIALLQATLFYGKYDISVVLADSDSSLDGDDDGIPDDIDIEYDKQVTKDLKTLYSKITHKAYNCEDYNSGGKKYEEYLKEKYIPTRLNFICADPDNCTEQEINFIFADIENIAYVSNTAYGKTCSLEGDTVCPGGVIIEGIDEPIPLEEYVKGVVYRENKYGPYQKLLAFSIAVRSFTLSRTEMCTKTIKNSSKDQTFAPNQSDEVKKAVDETAGMVMTYMSGDEEKVIRATYDSFCWYAKDDNGNYIMHYKKPPSNTLNEFVIPKDFAESIVGNSTLSVPCWVDSHDNHGMGMSIVGARYYASINHSYEEILRKFYDFDEIKTLNRRYINGIVVPTGQYIFNGNFKWYHQCDAYFKYYSRDPDKYGMFSSNSRWAVNGYASICTHGCGPTSLAMVVTSFLGEEHNQTELTKRTCQNGYCSSSGTDWEAMEFIPKRFYGLNVETVGKDEASVQKVVDALATGEKLVIAIMGPGKYTSGGHYIVLAGINGDGKALVYDPNSRQTRNGDSWDEFDVIVKENKGSFWIISR